MTRRRRRLKLNVVRRRRSEPNHDRRRLVRCHRVVRTPAFGRARSGGSYHSASHAARSAPEVPMGASHADAGARQCRSLGSLDPRVFGDNVQIDELRRPVEYLCHQLTHGLKARLPPWILLACPSLLLAFERDDHVHSVRILVVTGGGRTDKSRTGLFEVPELISKNRKLGVFARLQMGLDDLNPHRYRPLDSAAALRKRSTPHWKQAIVTADGRHVGAGGNKVL